jgi:hypothetical protein
VREPVQDPLQLPLERGVRGRETPRSRCPAAAATTGPDWLRVIASWNPVSALTAACRQLFGNPGAAAGATAWPLQHPVPATLIWSAVLLVVFAALSVHRYVTAGK